MSRYFVVYYVAVKERGMNVYDFFEYYRKTTGGEPDILTFSQAFADQLGGKPFHGNIAFNSEIYPNRIAFSQQLKEEMGYVDVCVFGVEELDEDDFLDWVTDHDKL